MLKNPFRGQVKKIKEPVKDEVGVALLDLYLVVNNPLVAIIIIQIIDALFQSGYLAKNAETSLMLHLRFRSTFSIDIQSISILD
jgi:hypothetical protein